MTNISQALLGMAMAIDAQDCCNIYCRSISASSEFYAMHQIFFCAERSNGTELFLLLL